MMQRIVVVRSIGDPLGFEGAVVEVATAFAQDKLDCTEARANRLTA
jgi:hypothetical protein